MSAPALEALAAAKAAGVKITLDGDGLILEANPLPSDIVALLKTVKPDLLRVLAGREAAQRGLERHRRRRTARSGAGPMAQYGLQQFVERRLGRSGGAARLDDRRALPRAAGLELGSTSPARRS